MPGLKRHGLEEWLSELHLFTNWYCPAFGIEPDVASWDAAWAEVLAPVAGDGLGPVTVLRDYHAENIMLVAGRDGIAHLGLLDFQDAVDRPPGLRSGLDARGCAARRHPVGRAGDDRPLYEGDGAGP